MAKEIKTSIVIQATPEKIWTILTDFDNYPNWNPFITSINGIVEKGNKIAVNIVPSGSKGMTFKPLVISRIENKELIWKGRVFINGLFDGMHKFELVDNGNATTTFIQSEFFTGIFVVFFNTEKTKEGFEKMNIKLKELAERK